MSNGSILLDSTGRRWLDSSGRIILDDGSGNCCKRQARKCTDDSLSGLWLPVSSIPSDPYYVKRGSDSLCYYFQGSDPADPCPGHTDMGSVTGQSDCNCNVCFTKFTITWSCLDSTWGAWTNAGNFCLPATTSTARTRTSGSSYQQYVQAAGPVSCTVNGDCSGHTATTPAVPTDTPTDATGTGCATCGCSHTVPGKVRITIGGTTLQTACLTAADNTGSFKVTGGSADGTYDDCARLPGGTCRWEKVITGGAAPVLLRDCFDLDCSLNNGPDSPTNTITVALGRSGANTWQITATNSPSGGTYFYDSGPFTWNDQNACDGIGSGAQANISPGATLPTGCAPTWAASGGTASAIFV